MRCLDRLRAVQLRSDGRAVSRRRFLRGPHSSGRSSAAWAARSKSARFISIFSPAPASPLKTSPFMKIRAPDRTFRLRRRTGSARPHLLAVFAASGIFQPAPDDGPKGEHTTINLVKTDAGPWNFQFLLGSAPAISGAMPAIKMRGGRVNFKFGDTKSVFYFNDADFDVSPSDDGSVDLRFSGAPSRTDQVRPEFRAFLRARQLGASQQPRYESGAGAQRAGRSGASAVRPARLRLHGIVAFDAQLMRPAVESRM